MATMILPRKVQDNMEQENMFHLTPRMKTVGLKITLHTNNYKVGLKAYQALAFDFYRFFYKKY